MAPMGSSQTLYSPRCVRLGYFPKSWRIFLTIALRKPGRATTLFLKFQLIHFVSPRRHKTHYNPLPLKIGDIVIQPTETAKLLGVMLDFKLSFRQHVELAQARGTKATLALSRIATPNLRPPPLLHAPTLSECCGPADGIRLAGVGTNRLLNAEETRRAGTVTDVLDFHAHLLPVHILLNRSAYNAAARLASLPSSNPIRHTFQRCRRVPRFHRSPVHHLINACPVFKSDFETIDPQRRLVPLPPGSFSTHIAADKDTARADMERITARGGMCIFTDGSGFDEGAGAAAVAMSEVCGAILALDIIADTPRLTDVDIFLDCQPALSAPSSPKSQPGKYLLATFHAVLGRLLRTRRPLKVRLRWVPAHVGIAGNELVDSLAKEAAQGVSTALRTRIRLFESPLPLRTGHIGLNAYLFRFHLAPSPLCPHCNMPESVPHLLLACPAYRTGRLRLFTRLGTARVSLRRLLSSKHDPSPVLAFVRDTRRLPSYAL
ncbi:hypothetical protein R3P38DRAFT_3234154 [Favolaschia claudopus]|uniref:RNase H type-1 domain-containing protein n=1 Tax=Favolaschia claudopus TaxID=2862362 RepID=A0AAV9ZGI2_9AGAR